MIFVRDKGRMCNNILQYAHVYAWAREHGRRSVSMRFCYKYQYFSICNMPWHNFATYVFAKYASKWHLLPIVTFDEDTSTEDHYAVNEAMMKAHNNIVVEGWYVRYYDLFLKYKSEILQLFAFDKKIIEGVSRAMSDTVSNNRLEKTISLGVHIRRGDYKTWMGGKYFYSDEVYIRNIKAFRKFFFDKNLCVYICGNDPSLDRDRITKELDGIMVTFPDGSPGEDLCLLSECDYIIGAPSTFSLVASMYHDTPIYWIEESEHDLSISDFSCFDILFKNIK